MGTLTKIVRDNDEAKYNDAVIGKYEKVNGKNKKGADMPDRLKIEDKLLDKSGIKEDVIEAYDGGKGTAISAISKQTGLTVNKIEKILNISKSNNQDTKIESLTATELLENMVDEYPSLTSDIDTLIAGIAKIKKEADDDKKINELQEVLDSLPEKKKKQFLEKNRQTS